MLDQFQTWHDEYRASLAPSPLEDINQLSAQLDMTHAHPSGVAQLFAAGHVTLESMFRDNGMLRAAERRLGRVLESQASKKRVSGVAELSLIVGVAIWKGSALPVLLYPVDVTRSEQLGHSSLRFTGKVSLNSAAVRDPSLISQAAAAFGSQAVVVAIDAKRVGLPGEPGADKWEVFTAGGRNATGIDAVAWAEEAARRGAGEILLTSMDRDGTKAGFDLALTRAVARAVPIPVIASGGVGTLEHFAEGVIEGEADAVLAASVFHFGTFSIREVKEYMASQGIPVRLDF